jgi:hypothetical protein
MLGDAIACGETRPWPSGPSTRREPRQVLRWSPRLKGRLGVEDRNGEDAAADKIGGTVVATLDAQDLGTSVRNAPTPDSPPPQPSSWVT